jgi:sortase A
MRSILRRVGWTLIGAGLLVLAFLGYQLFVTDLLNSRIQTEARADLDRQLAERRVQLPAAQTLERDEVADEPGDDEETVEAPSTTDTTAPPEPTVDYVPEEAGEDGSTLGRLIIPAIEVDEVMFEGVGRETLKKGPGHMPGTPVPGQPGNAVISGHRTTYGRPFYDLDQLEEGDEITLVTAAGTHLYRVSRSFVVLPTDVWVTEQVPGAWLTLTTCHPHFSAAERLIIRAELVEGPNLEYAQLLEDGATVPEEVA